jgi:Glycosyl transferases group 1
MRHAFPDTTEFYSTVDEREREDMGPVRQRYQVSISKLPGLARRLADPTFDLIVVNAPASAPWSLRAINRSLLRRGILRGDIPFFRMFAHQMLRGPVAAPIAVIDEEDSPVIFRHQIYLLDKATLYFKRELPTDYWRAFVGTLHPRIPTPRFRASAANRRRIEKLRPISLGVKPDVLERWKAPPFPPLEKKTDVFFAGKLNNSATTRERGLDELQALATKGIIVDVPEYRLSMDEYLTRCARSWLAWCPEGLGWDCFRTYEVAFCGSVPLISRATIEMFQPFIDGMHALYYDVENGGLSRTIEAAFKDRGRLLAIGERAKGHVLKHHTLAASARYIVESTLSQSVRKPPICTSERDPEMKFSR